MILDSEKIALSRCLNVLDKFDIYIIYPTGLDLKLYKIHTANKENVKYLDFESPYFQDIAGYNKLMLSTDLYKKFNFYKYMLVYQLDCYIFEDNILHWCNKGYDYIGAPWLDWEWSKHYASHLTFTRRILSKVGYKSFNMVGNGGFSLRKVDSFIKNLTFFSFAAKKFYLNEDYFFSFFINSYNPFFKVAPYKEALNFSFDENPEKLFIANQYQLPMACHAWPKYITFWKNYIKEL